MRFPSKVTQYEDSSLPSFLKILSLVEKEDITVIDLYKKVKSKVNINDFVTILDTLFSLGYIVLNDDNGVIHYVKND